MSRKSIVVLIMVFIGAGTCSGQQYYQARGYNHSTAAMPPQYPTQEQLFAMQQAEANRVRLASYMQQPTATYDAHSHQALIAAQQSVTDENWARMRQQANAELAQRHRSGLPAFPHGESYQAYGQQPVQAYAHSTFPQHPPSQAFQASYAQDPSQGIRLSDANPYLTSPNRMVDQPAQYSGDPFADQPPYAGREGLSYPYGRNGGTASYSRTQEPAPDEPVERPQDPFSDQPPQQLQDPFSDQPQGDEIDPFADPPSENELQNPQMREPTEPEVFKDEPEVMPPPQPSPAQPQNQREPHLAAPELGPPVNNYQNQTPRVQPRPYPQAPMVQPDAFQYDPSRVGSPEAYVPPVPYDALPSPNLQQPLYYPPAMQGGTFGQPYNQPQPLYVPPKSMVHDGVGCYRDSGPVDHCLDQFDSRYCRVNDARCGDCPFYWSIFGGLSQINSFDEVFNPGVGENVFCFDDGWGVGAAVGSSQGYNLRTEFDFTYRQIGLGSLVNTANPNRSPTTGNLNAYSGLWNAYWEFMGFPSERFKPYVGGGLGFVFLSPDFQSNGETVSGGTRSNFAFQGMAGVNFKYNCRTDFYAEYRYFIASEVQLDSSAVAYSNFDLDAQNIFVGLRRKF